jgi:tetratricopeptide (TPR) repeat protein
MLREHEWSSFNRDLSYILLTDRRPRAPRFLAGEALGWVPVAQPRQDALARAIHHHRLAISGHAARRLLPAARAARQAATLYAAAEGPRHPDVANALVELGQIEEARERLRHARRAYQRALRILAATGNRPPTDRELGQLRVRARILLAGTERALGRFVEADRGYRRAFADARGCLAAHDPDRAGLLNNWGMLRKYQGRFAEAIRLYQRALRIVRANRDREALANLYHNLGGIEHARGRFAAGVPHARRSVALRQSTRGRNHPLVAADLAALAALLDGAERRDEAATVYQRALAIFRRRLGPHSSEMALALAGLADLRQKQGQLATAERLYRRSLAILESILGSDHPDVALTLHNLAHLLRAGGDLKGAQPLYARALRTFERALGPRHPHTRACRAGYRKLLTERTRVRRAHASGPTPPRRRRDGISSRP